MHIFYRRGAKAQSNANRSFSEECIVKAFESLTLLTINMKKVEINGLHLWQFENLRKEGGIKHFVTDRSPDKHRRDFTLSFSSSPDKEEIRSNRRLLSSALSIQDDHLYLPSQVHKTRIVNVTRGISKEALMETDALITREKGICIAVMSADCVTILLYDKKNHAAGAVHSGW